MLRAAVSGPSDNITAVWIRNQSSFTKYLKFSARERSARREVSLLFRYFSRNSSVQFTPLDDRKHRIQAVTDHWNQPNITQIFRSAVGKSDNCARSTNRGINVYLFCIWLSRSCFDIESADPETGIWRELGR